MEPIANSAGVLRPLSGASAELGALLRDGRVLQAEVLSPTNEGTLLLAIGRHTVPAQSNLRLDPGTRFLVQVQQTGEGAVLQLLSTSEGQEAALLRALRVAVGDGRPLGEVLGELFGSVRSAAAGGAPGRPALGALSLALGALFAGLEGQGEGGGLRTLLGFLGLEHEARLAALGGGPAGAAQGEELRGDLKALLLRAWAELGETSKGGRGGLSESLGRALSALEAEQLLNLARERSGEPLVYSFPFPDGDGWATARLRVPGRQENSAGGEDEGSFRVSVGVELTQLGPVRADFSLTPAGLSVRLLVTRPEVVGRIEEQVAELREKLGSGRGAVEVHVRLGTPQQASFGFSPLDIRYLRENHLMNVAG